MAMCWELCSSLQLNWHLPVILSHPWVILESSLSSSTWKVRTKRVMRSRMVLEATTSDHNPRLAPDHGFRGSKTSADQCFPAVGFPWQSQLNLPLDNHESRPSPLFQTVNHHHPTTQGPWLPPRDLSVETPGVLDRATKWKILSLKKHAESYRYPLKMDETSTSKRMEMNENEWKVNEE